MRFRAKAVIERGQMDLIPLVNVMFLLLIFFMITSSFIFQPGITVDLPKAMTSEVIHKESLNIIVTGDNRIFIDDDPVSEQGLEERLSIAGRNARPVLIKSDRKASFGYVVKIWDLCRAKGVRKVNIATGQK